MRGFEFCAGTITGADHVKMRRNNQDAWWVSRSETLLVAVVADGCGSGIHSEVGATLGVRLMTTTLQSVAEQRRSSGAPCPAGDAAAMEMLLDEAHRRTMNILIALGHEVGGDQAEVLRDHFLFTLIGVMITPTRFATFSLGDGLIACNGKVSVLGPFPGNRPPYLMYRSLEGSGQPIRPENRFLIHQCGPVDDLRSVLIGTDGVADAMMVAEQQLPGKTETFGPLSQFWTEDFFFENPDGIRRRLYAANDARFRKDGEQHRLIKTQPLLRDDTTLVAIRRGRED